MQMEAATASAAAAAVLLNPLAALAALPPLEELPIDDLKPLAAVEAPTLPGGINGNVLFLGPPLAVLWALTWVTQTKPSKDNDGTYKTYIGGGSLPPEGYMNPLDPRTDERMVQEDDPLFQEKKSKKAALEQGSKSAVV